MHTVFAAQGANPTETWRRWTAISSREFYDGSLESHSADVPEFVFDKGLAFPISITRLRSSVAMGYRRSWQHIRANRLGVRVIWFVRQGTLRFTRAEGDFAIGPGEAGIVNTDVPFCGRIACDRTGTFESIQALVPVHLFLSHFPDAQQFTGRLSLDSPHGRLVTALLSMLIEEGEDLSDKATLPLVASFLEANAACVSESVSSAEPRRNLGDRRLANLKSYILMNFADPNLNADRVAAGCGMSLRYLSHVLHANRTCFTELLWQQRLRMARQLLAGPKARGRLINEVAFMSGFKSAAHFCRMFKETTGCTPGAYRAAHPGRA